MLYKSSRGLYRDYSCAEVIKTGIAPDGGLFVPDYYPKFELAAFNSMKNLSYQERALLVLTPYLNGFSATDLSNCVRSAYRSDNFADARITPLRELTPNCLVQELWHGPTCAFKDMALQILPHLMTVSLKITGENKQVVILVATSGDTGKAALEGFKDVPGVRILVFFPEEGVSIVQKQQMITQTGKNVKVIAVDGNFDDTQTGVKKIFANSKLTESLDANNFLFSSANSINWGRLVPQIVYYINAYVDLLKNSSIKVGEKLNFVVPTGNFGNILAGYYAKRMGLPINKLICASNSNNVITDFVRTGTYNRIRTFHKTASPSMDILVSSNLERLLFELCERDSGRVKHWMDELHNHGIYSVDSAILAKLQNEFWSDFCDDQGTINTIAKVWEQYNYLMDPHTAVGYNVYEKYQQTSGDQTKTVLISTASPYKFGTDVAKALLPSKIINESTEYELLQRLADFTGVPIPEPLQNLKKRNVLHNESCTKENMEAALMKWLSIA